MTKYLWAFYYHNFFILITKLHFTGNYSHSQEQLLRVKEINCCVQVNISG
jgi:hypothetical protein